MSELARIRPDGDPALPDVIRPVATAAALVESFTAYQELEQRLLVDDDYQLIERKRRKKKSAWRKLSTAFGVSLQLKEKGWDRDDLGRIVSAEATAVATAPNGRFADGWGGAHVTERCCPRDCHRAERNPNHRHCAAAAGVHTDPWAHWTQPYHDLRALAETRAKNRAASDLFGFGEVSAEEIGERDDAPPERTTTTRRPPRQSSGSSSEPRERRAWKDQDEQDRSHESVQKVIDENDLGEWVAMFLDSVGYKRWPLSLPQYRHLRSAIDKELRDRTTEADEQAAHEQVQAEPDQPEGQG